MNDQSNHKAFITNLIPVPPEIESYFIHNTLGATLCDAMAECFNFFAINTTDATFYDNLMMTYEDATADERDMLISIHVDLAQYLFDYVMLRPQYHFLFFMHTKCVEQVYDHLVFYVEQDENAVEMFIDRPTEWRYIRAEQFGIIRDTVCLSSSGPALH